MFKRIILLTIVLTCIVKLYGQQHDLDLKLSLPDQNIFVGEPIVLKCTLINNGSEPIIIYCAPYEPLLTTGILELYLRVPNDTVNCRYGVSTHVTLSQAPDFSLNSGDTIYWYAIVSWKNWRRGNSSSKSMHSSNFTSGEYQLQCVYNLLSENRKDILRIFSDVCEFNANEMPKHDLNDWNVVEGILNHYIGYPGNMTYSMYDRAHEILPTFIDKNNIVIAKYCHYILAHISPLSSRMTFCQSFLEKYPNTILAEEIVFWLARAYAGAGEKDISEKIYAEATKKFPNNVKRYYYRNIKSTDIEEE